MFNRGCRNIVIGIIVEHQVLQKAQIYALQISVLKFKVDLNLRNGC